MVTTTWGVNYRPVYFVNETMTPKVNVKVQLTNQVGTNSKTSVENPKWRDQVRRHQNATTGRSIQNYSFGGGHGEFSVDFFRFTTFVETHSSSNGTLIYCPSPTSPLSLATADQKARMKFLKRSKAAQTAFRSFTFLGELTETLRMIRRPGQGLRRGLDDYLRTVKKRSRSVSKRTPRKRRVSVLNSIVAETWLEHVYGWAPFISDARSAADGLNRRLERYKGSYTRVSGSGSEETYGFQWLPTKELYALQYQWGVDAFRRSDVKYYGEIKSVCENPIQADMTLFGATWREIIPTAWELIPYSFVVDYFTNVGDVLDAWSIRSSDFAWVSKNTKQRIRYLSTQHTWYPSFTQAIPGFRGWISSSFDVGQAVAKYKDIQRNATTPPLPKLSWEIPGLGTKWINLSALAVAKNRTRRQLFR